MANALPPTPPFCRTSASQASCRRKAATNNCERSRLSLLCRHSPSTCQQSWSISPVAGTRTSGKDFEAFQIRRRWAQGFLRITETRLGRRQSRRNPLLAVLGVVQAGQLALLLPTNCFQFSPAAAFLLGPEPARPPRWAARLNYAFVLSQQMYPPSRTSDICPQSDLDAPDPSAAPVH